MSLSPATFTSAGQTSQHVVPGVYSRRNTIGGSTGVSTGKLCIIGAAEGGEPLKLHAISDTAEAKRLLRSGPLLDGVCEAFNGSNTYTPDIVYCMRINKGTQSILDLKSTVGDSVLKLYSKDYGLHTNMLKLWLLSGTTTGLRVKVSFNGSELEADGIGKESFTLLYTGEYAPETVSEGDDDTITPITSAYCTINADGLTIATDMDSENFFVSFSDCETLEDLVSKINDSGKYTAVLLANGEDETSELDHVNTVSVLNNAATFSSDLKALTDALLSFEFIGKVEVGPNRVLPDVMASYAYFSGAESGTQTTSDYLAALEALEKEDVQIVATPNGSEEVRALILSHCVEMSKVSKKKERTCWLGTTTDAEVDNAISIAKALNSELCSLVTVGAVDIDPLTGEIRTISPALLSCKCAGMEAAMSPSNPLTNKAIKVSSFTKRYTQGEYSRLIQNGVVTFGENDEGELVCIRSITTYQGDSLVLNERSMIRSVLYMDRDLRKAFNKRIGTNAEPSVSTVLQTLLLKAKEWYADDLLTKNENGELFENAKVRFDGDKTYLTFERYIRAPVNFVFITATNKVYSSTLEI